VLKMRLSVSVLLATAACAGSSAPEAAPSPQAPASARSSRTVLTPAELSDPSLGDIDALAAVKRLRPQFLANRGTISANTSGGGVVHVIVNGGPMLASEALASIRANEILELRYLNVSEAAQQYGNAALAGPVIVVRRK
jgi:hypothetical protein